MRVSFVRSGYLAAMYVGSQSVFGVPPLPTSIDVGMLTLLCMNSTTPGGLVSGTTFAAEHFDVTFFDGWHCE